MDAATWLDTSAAFVVMGSLWLIPIGFTSLCLSVRHGLTQLSQSKQGLPTTGQRVRECLRDRDRRTYRAVQPQHLRLSKRNCRRMRSVRNIPTLRDVAIVSGSDEEIEIY